MKKYSKGVKLKSIEVSDEILFYIFEYLSPKDLYNVFLVNKKFYKFANDEYFWYIGTLFTFTQKKRQQFCKNVYKKDTKICRTWKEEFIYCTKFKYMIQVFIIR